MPTDLTGLIPHGWSGGEAVTKWWRGKHLHLYRLRKNCAQCQKEMTIDVTKAAITGAAKNAGLHLTRCVKCREQSRAADSQQPSMSRPFTKDDPIDQLGVSGPNSGEIEALRAQNEMFLRSVQALTARNAELNAELVKIRSATLAVKAQYELQPAMAAQAALPPEPMTLATSTAALKAAKNKMPWEG